MFVACTRCGNAKYSGAECPHCAGSTSQTSSNSPRTSSASTGDQGTQLILRLGLSLGVLAIIGAAFVGYNGRTYSEDLKQTTGTVAVMFETVRNGGTFRQGHYHTVVRYNVGGTQHEIPAPGEKEGSQVKVYYAASKPADGRLSSTNHFYILAGGFGVLGLFLAGACGIGMGITKL